MVQRRLNPRELAVVTEAGGRNALSGIEFHEARLRNILADPRISSEERAKAEKALASALIAKENKYKLLARFKEQYGEEYAQFLWADFVDPQLCPYCRTETLRKLWLGDPNKGPVDSVWGKWYMWCQSCLRGIYCPLGTYAVPLGQPFIRWGDEAALRRALPADLRLLKPTPRL
jgi:hypothetical protein